MRDAIEVVRTFPASYVIGLIISNRLFFSPTNMNAYFSDANRRADTADGADLQPAAVRSVGARPAFMQQPHFGFVKRNDIGGNTSSLLMRCGACCCPTVICRRGDGVLAADLRTSKPRASSCSASSCHCVGTCTSSRPRSSSARTTATSFNIEPLFMVLTVTAQRDLVREIRARCREIHQAESVRVHQRGRGAALTRSSTSSSSSRPARPGPGSRSSLSARSP